MKTKTDGTKESFVNAVRTAILRGSPTIQTNILIDGVNEVKSYTLPKGQTTGTDSQCVAYANQVAERIYTETFTNLLTLKQE